MSPGPHGEGVVSRKAEGGLDGIAEPLQTVQPLPESGVFTVLRLPVGLYGRLQPIQHFVHGIQVEYLSRRREGREDEGEKVM